MAAIDQLIEKLWAGDTVTLHEWTTARRADDPGMTDAAAAADYARNVELADAEGRARAAVGAFEEDVTEHVGATMPDLRAAFAAYVEARTALVQKVTSYSTGTADLHRRFGGLWGPLKAERPEVRPPAVLTVTDVLNLGDRKAAGDNVGRHPLVSGS